MGSPHLPWNAESTETIRVLIRNARRASNDHGHHSTSLATAGVRILIGLSYYRGLCVKSRRGNPSRCGNAILPVVFTNSYDALLRWRGMLGTSLRENVHLYMHPDSRTDLIDSSSWV
jgi:hypothetical protein